MYSCLGWVEGPMGEYADLRGLSEACMDLMIEDNKPLVHKAMDIITENALEFAKIQIEAGAHCIGIGDPAPSQIGPALYKEFVWKREKYLVEHINSMGALAKTHICGNTTAILPGLIKTKTNIIDIDHMVTSLPQIVPLLGFNQVVWGNSDPVSVIQDGDAELINASLMHWCEQTQGLGIIAAGCEVTPDTTVTTFTIWRDAVQNILSNHCNLTKTSIHET